MLVRDRPSQPPCPFEHPGVKTQVIASFHIRRPAAPFPCIAAELLKCQRPLHIHHTAGAAHLARAARYQSNEATNVRRVRAYFPRLGARKHFAQRLRADNESTFGQAVHSTATPGVVGSTM